MSGSSSGGWGLEFLKASLIDFPSILRLAVVFSMCAQHSSVHQFLVLLCALTLQLQLFASSAMTCKYAGTLDDGTAISCPFHWVAPASQGIDNAGSMLDCQKCVLGFFLSGCHPIGSTYFSSFFRIPHIDVGGDLKHFYDFVPDWPDRPPISLQS
jgi:hypothetical protein